MTNTGSEVRPDITVIGPPSTSISTMFLRSLKKYDTPFLKPLWPIFAGSVITFYLFSGVSRSMSQLPQYVNDPQNPYATKKHE